MKNATLQLFEYLLAAQNSSIATVQNVNDYPVHWFLDELLTYRNVELVRSTDGESKLVIHCPDKKHKKVEDSLMLAILLDLLQYDEENKQQVLIGVDELRENLVEELDAVNRKIGNSGQGKIILNEWQKLLLGVPETSISHRTAIIAQGSTYAIMEPVLAEYQVWLEKFHSKNADQTLALKERHLYEWLMNLASEDGTPLEVNFGVGMLYINGENPISHPLLTVKCDVLAKPKQEEVELRFGNQTLTVDNILNYILFYGADIVQEMKDYVTDLALEPFDLDQVATVMQKIIKVIHPNGQYFASPAAAIAGIDHLPQVLHMSVIYAKEKQPYDDVAKQKTAVAKQKSLVKYLSKKKPSDVLGSVVDPNYVTPNERATDYRVPNPKNMLYPWAGPGAEHQILALLDYHNAVAVTEPENKNNHYLTVNLLTHLIATGKRILVVGEDDLTLDRIQCDLPTKLSGLHTKLASNYASYAGIKSDLATLMDRRASNEFTKSSVDDLRNEIQLANAELSTLIDKIVQFRELGSRKNYWHGERYYPEAEQMIKDSNEELPFDIDSEEVERYWRLRPYFTPENMELLNYEFINIDELTEYYAYDRMLALEEKYLQQVYANPGLDDTFENGTDIKFMQYLYTELPKLMKEVANVKTEYGNKVLKQAIVNAEVYHELAAALGRINIELKDINCFDTTAFQREVLIGKLNNTFEISNLDMATIDTNNIAQLWDFYQQKKEELTIALVAANSILAFNTEAIELSRNFKGISDDGLEYINVLYDAAALYISKFDFEESWKNVRDYFISYYMPIVAQPDIHPSCINLFEALKKGSYEEFKVALETIQDVLLTRHNFITFGEFIEKLGKFAPTFTATMMSENHGDDKLVAYFENAMNKAKLDGGLAGQISVGESELLENGIDYLLDYLLQLQHDLIACESWKNTKFAPKDVVVEVNNLLAIERPLDEVLVGKILSCFSVIFMPLSESGLIKNYDPNRFDLVIFADANKSNVMRLSELMHAHKAILFGSEQDTRVDPLSLGYYDFNRLAGTYGQTLHQFGEQYFNNSLLNLLANSAAWDAKIILPRYAMQLSVNEIADDVKSGEKVCDTHVEDEIFDALVGNGYDVKCKIDVGNTTLDFLISGEYSALAINVLGDNKLDRDEIKAQLEQEVELRKKGLYIRTIQSAHFYLNSRKTLMELYDYLEKLGIHPKNN